MLPRLKPSRSATTASLNYCPCRLVQDRAGLVDAVGESFEVDHGLSLGLAAEASGPGRQSIGAMRFGSDGSAFSALLTRRPTR